MTDSHAGRGVYDLDPAQAHAAGITITNHLYSAHGRPAPGSRADEAMRTELRRLLAMTGIDGQPIRVNGVGRIGSRPSQETP
jgi:hypothetical protein